MPAETKIAIKFLYEYWHVNSTVVWLNLTGMTGMTENESQSNWLASLDGFIRMIHSSSKYSPATGILHEAVH